MVLCNGMLAPIRPICKQTQEKKKKNPNLCSTTGQNVGGGDQIERTSDKHTHTHKRVGFIT